MSIYSIYEYLWVIYAHLCSNLQFISLPEEVGEFLLYIMLKEELKKRDELLAGYLKQIEIQEEFIQKQKELIEYLEEHISKITDIVSGV